MLGFSCLGAPARVTDVANASDARMSRWSPTRVASASIEDAAQGMWDLGLPSDRVIDHLLAAAPQARKTALVAGVVVSLKTPGAT